MKYDSVSCGVNYILLSIIVLAFLTILGCSEEIETFPSGTKVFGKLGDSKKQDRFIEVLENEGIYYKLSKRNYIIYKVNDTKRLLAIKRKVLYGDYLDPAKEEAIAISSVNEKEKYISKLNEEGIPYRITESEKVMINGHEYKVETIRYSQIYGPQVDSITQQIYKEGTGP